MWLSETVGGGSASARSTFASASGSCGASLRSAAGQWRRPEPEPAIAFDGEPLPEPGGSLLHAPVLRKPPRELSSGLFGLELAELGGLVGEERARLQLEQRGDQDEELAAGLEIEFVSFRQELDEREHDRRDVDLARLELLLQEKREEQIERAFERVEIERQLTHRGRGHGRRLATRPDADPRARVSRWGASCSDAGGTSRFPQTLPGPLRGRFAGEPSRFPQTPPRSASRTRRFASSAKRPRELERLVAREVTFQPIRDSVALPDQNVACEPRGLLDDLAGGVDEQNQVRLAGQEEPAGPVHVHLLDHGLGACELLQEQELVDGVERRLSNEEPHAARRAVEEPHRAAVAEVDAIRLRLELADVETCVSARLLDRDTRSERRLEIGLGLPA